MRRQYIVDKKFQWTVVGYTIVISMLTTMVHETINRLDVYQLLRTYDGIGGIVGAYIRPEHMKLIAYGVFYFGVFIVALLFSNRLAGPLYRLRRHMNDIAHGRPVVKIYFRRDDYFSELNQAYNALVDSLALKNKGKDENGFSLPEVMIVVAIAAILATISAVTIFEKPKDDFLFKQEVTSLKDALLTARNAAVTKNHCVLATRVNSHTLSINSYPMPAPCDTDPLPAADVSLTQTFRQGTSISDFSNGATLIFRPGGGTMANEPVTITITSGQLNNQLTVFPAIGQVRHQ